MGKNILKFNEDFIKNYDEDSDKGYIFEVDVENPKNLHDLYSDLPFLPERMKINKCNKLACNLYDKNNYIVHIRSLKQPKNDFEKDFIKLMNISVFGKTMENVRKHRYIKLVTTDEKRHQLVSRPNYHTTKYCSENLLAIEMKKIKVKMNKSVYLGLSILEISKTLMYGFWYD